MRAYWSPEGDPKLLTRTARLLERRPWCGPPPGAARSEPLVAPIPGETLLLIFEPDTRRGGVWEIGPADSLADGRAAVVGRASAAHDAACKLAERCLPLVLPPPSRGVATIASPVWGACGVRSIDGPSVGLPMLLASLSTWLDVPIPATIAATGQLGEDRAIDKVGGLRAKIAVLYEGCPAVTRLLVPAVQLDDARAIDGPWRDDPHFTIEGVANVEQAIHAVWPDVNAPCRARLAADPVASARALKSYIDTSRGARWRAAARTAVFLRGLPGVDVDSLVTLEKIARRHSGERDVLLSWRPRESVSHREIWAQAAAQAVQSAGDGGHLDELRERLRLAERELRPLGDRSPAEIELVGAIGRGWAVLHEPGRAEAHLREATKAWFTIGQPGRCSRAMCEWVRVVGAFNVGDPEGVLARVDRWLTEFSFEPASVAYIRLELARARLALDLDPALALRDALAVLDIDPHKQPACSPMPSARRFKIRALRRLGRVDEADAEREALAALGPNAASSTPEQPSDPTAWTSPALADLDALVDGDQPLDGTPAHDALSALHRAWPVEYGHVERGVQQGDRVDTPALVRGMVRLFRY